MRVLFLIAGGAHASASRGPCTDLCNRDGPSICTGGSWTKPDGSCQAYLFLGPIESGEYCYHTAVSRVSCPSGGAPVMASDATRLLGIAPVTTGAPTHVPSTAAPTQVPWAVDALAIALESASSNDEAFSLNERELREAILEQAPPIRFGSRLRGQDRNHGSLRWPQSPRLRACVAPNRRPAGEH